MKKLIYLSILILLTFSCTKEKNITPTFAKSSLKGILSFKNAEEFLLVCDSLNKLPTNQAKGYKTEDGFLSLLTIQENYYECLERATDQSMYDNIILDHKDFLSKGSITDFKIYSKVVYPVINKDGIVQIDNKLYKFTEDGQIIVNNSDLELIISLNTSDKENNNIKIFKNSNFQTSKSGYCTFYHTTGLVYNGDRRCHLTSFLGLNYFENGDGTVWYSPYVWNEGIAEKRGIFGWRTYNTVNWLDLNYQVTLNTGFSKTTTESLSNSSYHITFVENIDEGTWPERNDELHMGTFDWINCNIYTTQGMAGITAEICCETDPYGK
jgi:hypothetical protein